MKKNRFAVVGLDISHAFSLPPLLRSCGLAPGFVHDTKPSRAAAFAERFQATVIDDLACMPWGEICGAIVTTTADRHAAAAIPFLERGIPVFFNKQLAASWEDGQRIAEAALLSNTPFLAGSARRYSPNYRSIGDHARSGASGRVISAQVFEPHGITPGGWQDSIATSGGFIVNHGIHCIDALVSVLGAEISEIHCFGGKLTHPDADSEDLCVITLQYRNGTIATVEVLGAQEPGHATQPWMRVHFLRGSLETYITEGSAHHYQGKPIHDPETYQFVTGELGLCRAIATLFHERQAVVPAEETLAVLKILILARRSYEEQRRIRWEEAG